MIPWKFRQDWLNTDWEIWFWNVRKNYRFSKKSEKIRKNRWREISFFSHFLNSWVPRKKGKGRYSQKYEKKWKSLHPNVHAMACPFLCYMPMFMMHVHVSTLYVRPWCMSIVHAPCIRCMSNCPCCLFMLLVLAACPCCVSMVLVHAARLCCRSMLRCQCCVVNVACQRCIAMLHVHASCLCLHAASPCGTAILHLHTAYPCYIFILHVHHAYPSLHFYPTYLN